MKAFQFLCIVILACGVNAHNVHLSSAQKEKVQQYTAECVKESGVKSEIIAEAKKGQVSEDDGFKKFIFCFFQKSGIVSSEGKLNMEVALSKLPAGIDKAAASKLLEECKNKKGKDMVDTTFEIFKCYYVNTKQHVIFF
ncbi:general odorant-binding protein 69a-like [Zerene cesonia]|uniref:general odorant-binding protein 69a-like n=1 Tax=Zerene cesonia TaxID=33412 RepID=UPI0018E52488|nr:general odorant-binding protein 69a-like [Zerene cesonia]